MLERKIRLNAVADVKEFVRAAEKCEYDVDIFYNRVVVDAKSILGVMSLDLTKTLTVKYCKEDEEILEGTVHFGDAITAYAEDGHIQFRKTEDTEPAKAEPANA